MRKRASHFSRCASLLRLAHMPPRRSRRRSRLPPPVTHAYALTPRRRMILLKMPTCLMKLPEEATSGIENAKKQQLNAQRQAFVQIIYLLCAKLAADSCNTTPPRQRRHDISMISATGDACDDDMPPAISPKMLAGCEARIRKQTRGA